MRGLCVGQLPHSKQCPCPKAPCREQQQLVIPDTIPLPGQRGLLDGYFVVPMKPVAHGHMPQAPEGHEPGQCGWGKHVANVN